MGKGGNGYYRADKMHEVVAKLVAEKLETVRIEARNEAIEACAQRCEMIADHMSPRFCASELRRMARRGVQDKSEESKP